MGVTTEKRMLRYHVREYERFILERLPAASEAAGRRIESSLCIIDLSGLSMKGSLHQKFYCYKYALTNLCHLQVLEINYVDSH